MNISEDPEKHYIITLKNDEKVMSVYWNHQSPKMGT